MDIASSRRWVAPRTVRFSDSEPSERVIGEQLDNISDDMLMIC